MFLLPKRQILSLPSLCVSGAKRCVHGNTVEAFNSEHLAAGSDPPAVDPERLTLYNMRFCMYAHRTVLHLLAKQIPFDMINVHLRNRPDWFVAKTPYIGKVPLIEYQGTVNYESFVLQEYLEEKFPEYPRLAASTPEGRARDKYMVELSKRFYGPLHKAIRAKTDEELVEVTQQIKTGLAIFEGELQTRGSKFFFSAERPGLLDYAVWPWFERLPAFQNVVSEDVMSDTPRLRQWVADMKTDPAVAAYAITPEDHWTFLTGLAEGKADYDLLYKRHAAKKEEVLEDVMSKKSAKAWGNILQRFSENKQGT